MTFQMKKRINTELPMDKMPALYIGEAQISVATNEVDQKIANKLIGGASIPCLEMLSWHQRCWNERSADKPYIEMSLTGMWWESNILIQLALNMT